MSNELHRQIGEMDGKLDAAQPVNAIHDRVTYQHTLSVEGITA